MNYVTRNSVLVFSIHHKKEKKIAVILEIWLT